MRLNTTKLLGFTCNKDLRRFKKNHPHKSDDVCTLINYKLHQTTTEPEMIALAPFLSVIVKTIIAYDGDDLLGYELTKIDYSNKENNKNSNFEFHALRALKIVSFLYNINAVYKKLHYGVEIEFQGNIALKHYFSYETIKEEFNILKFLVPHLFFKSDMEYTLKYGRNNVNHVFSYNIYMLNEIAHQDRVVLTNDNDFSNHRFLNEANLEFLKSHGTKMQLLQALCETNNLNHIIFDSKLKVWKLSTDGENNIHAKFILNEQGYREAEDFVKTAIINEVTV